MSAQKQKKNSLDGASQGKPSQGNAISMADLKIDVQTLAKCACLLTLEFPRRYYETQYTKVVNEMRRRIVRPGFRKGKLPREIVEREYGDHVRSQVMDTLIPSVISQAVEEKELKVISTPRLKSFDIDNPEAVRLEVEVELQPVIEVVGLDELKGEKWKPEVLEEDLEKALENIQSEHGELVSVERAVQDNDYVMVAYTPLDEKGNPKKSQQVENYPFQVGEGQVVPEFEEAVRGLVAGGETRAEVRYAEDHSDKDLAGKLVAFVLTVKEVKEKRIPDLDDEFAKDLDFENLETLQERVRQDLGKRLEEESDRDLQESLYESLVTANSFEVPTSVVERYLEAVVSDYEERFKQMRQVPEAAQLEEIRQSAAPAAERAVRRMLILEEIKKKNEMDVTEEAVDAWIEEKVKAEGGEDSKVRAFFSEPKSRQRLRDRLTDEKVFDFIKDKALVTEVPRPRNQAKQ